MTQDIYIYIHTHTAHFYNNYRMENFVAFQPPPFFNGVPRQSLISCFSLHALPRGPAEAVSLGHAVEAPFPSCFLSALSDSLSPSHGLPSLLSILFSEPDRDLWLVFRLFLSLSPQGFFPLLLFLLLFGGLLFFLFSPQFCFSSIRFGNAALP